jgi:hypothetical protein
LAGRNDQLGGFEQLRAYLLPVRVTCSMRR